MGSNPVGCAIFPCYFNVLIASYSRRGAILCCIDVLPFSLVFSHFHSTIRSSMQHGCNMRLVESVLKNGGKAGLQQSRRTEGSGREECSSSLAAIGGRVVRRRLPSSTTYRNGRSGCNASISAAFQRFSPDRGCCESRGQRWVGGRLAVQVMAVLSLRGPHRLSRPGGAETSSPPCRTPRSPSSRRTV